MLQKLTLKNKKNEDVHCDKHGDKVGTKALPGRLASNAKARPRPLTHERLALEALVQPLGGHHVLHHGDGRQELDRARHLAGHEVRALLRRLGDLPTQNVQLLRGTGRRGAVRPWATRPRGTGNPRPRRDPGGPGHRKWDCEQNHRTGREVRGGICKAVSVSCTQTETETRTLHRTPGTQACHCAQRQCPRGRRRRPDCRSRTHVRDAPLTRRA